MRMFYSRLQTYKDGVTKNVLENIHDLRLEEEGRRGWG
jgi:hypothetical protein